MKSLSRVVGLAVATLALVLGFFVAPANAAVPFVVCDAFPAPSISASGGLITMHYFHSCNTVQGVTKMLGQLELHGPQNVDFAPVDGQVQATAASAPTWPVKTFHGNYFVIETLTITGNFTTGPPAHGMCHRTSPTTVFCTWKSATIFA